MPEEPAGWFQGTADAIRKFIWVLEVISFSHKLVEIHSSSIFLLLGITKYYFCCARIQDYYNQLEIEHILILCGDQIYRMNFMELVQVGHVLILFASCMS